MPSRKPLHHLAFTPGLCLPPSCLYSVLIQSAGSHWDHKDMGHTPGKWKKTRLLTTLHNHPEIFYFPLQIYFLSASTVSRYSFTALPDTELLTTLASSSAPLFLSSDSRSFSTVFLVVHHCTLWLFPLAWICLNSYLMGSDSDSNN